MDPLTRIVVTLMCVLTASLGIANAKPAPVSAAGITTVTLKSTVRLAADADLTLGSIAHIEGNQRDLLEQLRIDTLRVAAGSWTTIPSPEIRSLIDESHAQAGSIVVLGAGSSITRLQSRASIEPKARVSEQSTGIVTVRDHLGSWLRSRFRASPDSIRIAYPERSGGLLRTPTDGRIVSVTEIGFSNKIAVRIDVYEGDHLVLSDSIRVGVQVRADALIVSRPIKRGSTLRDSDVRREMSWIDPSDPPATPTSSIGQSLLRSLQPGQIVREHHLEAPTMIERGQDVSVRTVQGTVVVTTVARARHSARQGELIELETKDSTRRRFTARVAGPGRVVMSDAPSERGDARDTSTGKVTPADKANNAITISDPPARDLIEMRPIAQDEPSMKPLRNTRR